MSNWDVNPDKLTPDNHFTPEFRQEIMARLKAMNLVHLMVRRTCADCGLPIVCNADYGMGGDVVHGDCAFGGRK